MAVEIAVFIGAEGTSTSLDEPGIMAVFRRDQSTWETDREQDFAIGTAKSMRELRLKMGEMVEFLGPCKVVVARSATGVPYFELEKARCSIWEVSGAPEDFLDHVLAGEEAERSEGQAEAPVAVPVPCETSPGYFFISIKEMQEKNSGVSSKQVLRQFLRNGGFRTLTVVCSHVPPWIEADAAICGLSCETEQLGKNEFTVRISRTVELP